MTKEEILKKLNIGEDMMVHVSNPFQQKGVIPKPVKLIDINFASGVGKIECPECDEDGYFWITDQDSQPCVLCKTNKWINVSLY